MEQSQVKGPQPPNISPSGSQPPYPPRPVGYPAAYPGPVGPAYPTAPQPVYGVSASGYAPVRPDEGLLPPVATAEMPGTPYRLAIVGLPSAPSGPASASLPFGIASILVSFAVMLFAAAGAQNGWGPAVSGAFALLSVAAAIAALSLGQYGLHQVRRAYGRVTGRGVAIAGIVCGVAGLVLTALAFLLGVAAAA